MLISMVEISMTAMMITITTTIMMMATTMMTMTTTITEESVAIIVMTERIVKAITTMVATIIKARALCCLLALFCCTPLIGKERFDHFMLGAGAFNMLRDNRSWQFQWEYRWDVGVYQLRPLASLMGTERGTIYLCGGAGWDIFLGKHLVLTPSFAPGLYFRGSGKSLHFPIEFRSAIELAYVFNNHGRVGAQFYHISNASLGHKNPGAESLIFFYAVPIGKKSSSIPK
jgi:lipid A 3-O-deacylase